MGKPELPDWKSESGSLRKSRPSVRTKPLASEPVNFPAWLEAELKQLESDFADHITQRSLQKTLRKSA